MTRLMFVFFLVSGFCSLAYEVTWLRLAMAGFGVTTPLVSIVLSVFMAGLGLGSWLGGRIARALEARGASAALLGYALCELVIGIGGLAVPRELHHGQQLLARLGDEVAWGSGAHHLAAGAWITLTLLPFCSAMGATFPLGVAALRRASREISERSFSYLYGANTLGAAVGALISAFVLIELFGFRGTGRAIAALNALIAAGAFVAGLATRARASHTDAPEPPRDAAIVPRPVAAPAAPWLLFATGLVSMGMEVVWVRQFSPYLGTVVYAFASMLAIYLGATFAGAIAYRRWSQRTGSSRAGAPLAVLWSAALVFGLLPLFWADPRIVAANDFIGGLVRLVFGIAPFCAAVGFLTPMLVDHWSGGDARRAGGVYAMNIIGCVVGPLVSSFVLLPSLGERGSLLVWSAPFAAIAVVRSAAGTLVARAALVGAGALCALIALSTQEYEAKWPERTVLRDYAATVVAATDDMGPALYVNGIGMTRLVSIAKVMVHLPLAHLAQPPRHALVVCFGMGTSFRSSVSWGVPTTVVDLIPSVPALFYYYHSDAERVLSAPGARVVVDDGRRFLERSVELFDVVTIDPPPPVEAAGSSLLYSIEFYDVIKRRLAPGGIVQQWLPGGDPAIFTAVAKALLISFPHVRAFRAIGGWGVHFLASMQPIPALDAAALANRLPPEASADLVEWSPNSRPAQWFEQLLAREIDPTDLVKLVPGTPALADDRPVNEYFFLRWWSGKRPWVQPS
jgi:spermidine synthase